jgi:hypothetical protein
MVQRPGYVNESVGDLVDYDTRPACFVPKTLDKYEVWVSNIPEEFKFFIDSDTRHLYWHEIQL